jgi:asparagine synthase (glutamine-hydrolysing)
MRMSAAMRKRGPDDEGYMIASHGPADVRVYAGPDTAQCVESLPYLPARRLESELNITGSVFFAHRRLSIIDLSSYGHQPMCTEDGRYWIVYNGEIYNHAELRAELERLGEIFLSGSDTEVLLKAYRRWGPASLDRFMGMFAFCIWDQQDKSLFFARDRIGVKPLYYCRQGDLLLFASDIATLVASGLYRAEPDIEGMYHALSFGVAPRPMTAFRSVLALKQAHWMRIDADGRTEMRRYWSIPLGSQCADMSLGEAAQGLEERLSRAVRRRLVADVPVGAFMSGGIDSTTVAAMAARQHTGIQAFTLAFQSDRELNELEQARATAGMYAMEHIVESVDENTVVDDLQNMVRCYEEPFYDVSPNYVISRLVASHGIKVILNGLGGDELFGGYPYFRWEKRWRLLQALRSPLRLLARAPCIGHLSQRLARIGECSSPDRFAVAVRDFVTREDKAQLFTDERVREFDTVERVHELYVGEDIRFDSFLEAVSYIDMTNYIGNHHVYRLDKFTMEFSIEGRLPFLDHELVEYAFAIPDRHKICQGQSKYVLRQVAAKYIHPSCLAAPKKGFDLPSDRWMRGWLYPFIQEKLTTLSRRGLFRPEAIWRIHREWGGRCRSFRSVWELVSVEMWLEMFIDRTS